MHDYLSIPCNFWVVRYPKLCTRITTQFPIYSTELEDLFLVSLMYHYTFSWPALCTRKMLQIMSRITPTTLYLPRYFTNFKFERSFLNIVFLHQLFSYRDSLLPLIWILYLCKNKYVITMTIYVTTALHNKQRDWAYDKELEWGRQPNRTVSILSHKISILYSLTALNKNNK